MDANDFLYDELSSFISTPNEYNVNHHDFDEIISSTISSTLDFNSLISPDHSTALQNDNFFSDLFPVTSSPDDIGLNFNNLSTLSEQSLTLDKTLSSFAPPESLNNSFNSFNNYGDTKFTCNDFLGNTQNRNTPSPTESCGSFGGSSTSGVHSDTSEQFCNEIHDQNNLATTAFVKTQSPMTYIQNCGKKDNLGMQECMQAPALTVSALNNHKVKEQAHYESSEIIYGSAKVPAPASGCVPMEVKKGIALRTEEMHCEKPPIKNQTDGSNKTKTIFLSSKDYKALMSKMNSNKGAKISGSVQTQMPKIVFKTGNEKVQSNQHVQATRLGHSQSMSSFSKPATLSNDTTIKSPQSVMTICRGKLDEKMYKKQQRMIKNRESASLSRKKKKDYVYSLETRINDLQKENHALKEENLTLHKQLVAFARTCRCNKGSDCGFVLHSLSSNNRLDQQVKIGSKPSSKSFRQRMNATTIKKNVAVLFAMAFMVTLNAGNFQSYLNKQNLDASSFDAVPDSNVKEPVTFGRRVLWVESEEEYNEKLNVSNRQLPELAIPPLHFLHHTNQRNNASNNKHLNSTDTSSFDKGNPPPLLTYPSSTKCKGLCNSSIPRENESNYSRLAMNLQKLIKVSGYRNFNMESKVDMEEETGFKFQTDYLELPVIEKQASKLGKRKTFSGFNERFSNTTQKLRKVESDNDINNSNTTKAIHLFKKINRRDDTLYVISFNTNNIILSPSSQNNNKRPKISLLLPSANPTQNGDIMMMQVDCEVSNTRELLLKSNMIPSGIGPSMGKWQVKHAANVNKNVEKFPEKPVKQEKPLIRTYFMVGPKNQAAAALSEQKPQLVQFKKSSVNDSNVLSAELDNRLYS